MSIIDHCKALLSSTETELQQLVGKAASRGDYQGVLKTTSCAQEIRELISRLGDSSPTNHVPTTKRPNDKTVHLESKVEPKTPNKATPQATKSAGPTKPRPQERTNNGNGYPKFFRRGDELVKVGWSKSAKKEYQHKATETILSLVASAISERAANQKLVSADEFLPLTDSVDGTVIPAYQAYLCIAWLRNEGLITQDGRQGYRLSDAGLLVDQINERWSHLKER